jgi:hypothetical protein
MGNGTNGTDSNGQAAAEVCGNTKDAGLTGWAQPERVLPEREQALQALVQGLQAPLPQVPGLRS